MKIEEIKKLGVFCAIYAASSQLFAWGPHPEITGTATSYLANEMKLQSPILSPENRNLMGHASVFPDRMGDALAHVKNLGTFQIAPIVACDGVNYKNKHLPNGGIIITHLYYTVPKSDYLDYFKLCIRAIESENPTIAALKIGMMTYFLGDTCAPQHNEAQYSDADVLKNHWTENWTPTKNMNLKGYKPKLIGKNKAETLENFSAWLESYYKRTQIASAKMIPLLKGKSKDELNALRPQIEAAK